MVKVKLFFIILIIIGLAVGAGFFVFWENLYWNSAVLNYPLIFEISSGMGLDEITDVVYSLGLIRSKIIFKIYVLATGAASRLQSGIYEIKNSVFVPELVKILQKGPEEIEVMIFPGMTLKEIDDYLSKIQIIKPGSLIYYGNFDKLKNKYQFLEGAKNLEGFLFPDTYRFYRGSDIDFIIGRILENFQNKIINGLTGNLNQDLLFKNKDVNLIKILIIASLLEKEAPDHEDRKIIAGIMEKRLKIGMPLQIDASVIYAKCSGRFLNCPSLESIDFKLDSDYNTYYYKGLTPTPIGNPDLGTIKAVVEKKDSRYWYYLSDPKTKKTIFSVDLDEHNKNRAKYLLNKKNYNTSLNSFINTKE